MDNCRDARPGDTKGLANISTIKVFASHQNRTYFLVFHVSQIKCIFCANNLGKKLSSISEWKIIAALKHRDFYEWAWARVFLVYRCSSRINICCLWKGKKRASHTWCIFGSVVQFELFRSPPAASSLVLTIRFGSLLQPWKSHFGLNITIFISIKRTKYLFFKKHGFLCGSNFNLFGCETMKLVCDRSFWNWASS